MRKSLIYFTALTVLLTLFLSTCSQKVDVLATGVTLDRTMAKLEVGGSLNLAATVLPEYAFNKNVNWTSSNQTIASVANGLITALSPGTAIIIVTTQDGGFTASCEIVVSLSVASMTLNKTSLTLVEGNSETLIATILPANASNKTVTWTSSNNAVATVTSDGIVIARSVGTTTITVTLQNGNISAACAVTVTAASVPVAGVILNSTKSEITVGSTLTLVATVLPENATNKNVVWTSTNPTVASVNNGVVIANSPGTASIIVTSQDGGKSATCLVTVTPFHVPVAGVTLNNSTAVISFGATLTLTATVLPENATNKNVVWTSSNPTVASISNGMVTALSPGTASIIVTTVEGGFTVTCKVTVNLAVSGITLNKTSLTLIEGNSETLIANITPANASNKGIIWTSSNANVATVINDGTVIAKSAGTTTITVITQDGSKSATCVVTVNAKGIPVAGVSLNAPTYHSPLNVGETLKLTATVLPADAYNPTVKWTSSNPSVAKVEESDGIMGEKAIVTALSPGETTIVVTTIEGGFTATIQITVRMAVTGISLNKTTLSLIEGNSETLIVTFTPANASNKGITWKTNNTAIATVDSDGKVTARTAGSTIITATTQDGSKSAECTVNVTASHVPVTSVTLNKTALDLVTGNSETLFVSVKPDNATNKNVGWTISPVSIATIDQYGKVSAVSAGTATVTVTSVDDNTKKATCLITVTPIVVPVTGISLSPTSWTVKEGAEFKVTPTITPSNATNKTINWLTSDPTIATIGNDGTVRGISPGKATIFATTQDGGKTAMCIVTVESNNVAVTNIYFASTDLTSTTLPINGSNTGSLQVDVFPLAATNRAVTWTSSDETVVIPTPTTSSGLSATITPVAPAPTVKTARTATITITSVSNPTVKATCVVTVNYVPVNALALNPTTISNLRVGATSAALIATVTPANASNKNVIWTSNSANAVVIGDGYVFGNAAGNATITATSVTETSVKADCAVTVIP